MCASCGSFKVSIDDLTPQRLNSMGSQPYNLVQREVWSNTSLDPGRHTLNITYDEDNGSGVYLDFFRQVINGVKVKGQTQHLTLPLSPHFPPCWYSVLPEPGTSTLPPSFSTTNLGELPTTVLPVLPTNQNQINKVPQVVGLTVGLLVLVVVVLCGVRHIYLRRGRRPIDACSVSPYTGPPIRRSDQQSSIPPVLKGVPQPARPPGAPMATVDPSMSSSEDGLEPPPVMKPHRTIGESTPQNDSFQ